MTIRTKEDLTRELSPEELADIWSEDIAPQSVSLRFSDDGKLISVIIEKKLGFIEHQIFPVEVIEQIGRSVVPRPSVE